MDYRMALLRAVLSARFEPIYPQDSKFVVNQFRATNLNVCAHGANHLLSKQSSLVSSCLSLFTCGNSQIVRIYAAVMHFPELAFQNQKGEDTDRNRYESEKGYPDRGLSGNSRSPVHGWLFLLLGCALVHLAFYIADETNPPAITRLWYRCVCVCGFFCIFHSD